MNDFTPIKFVDTDAQSIEQELITAYQLKTGQALYPGDPRRIFLMQILPVLVAIRNDINYTGNANLLPFAYGEVLDALGDRFDVGRLQSEPSKVNMMFELSIINLNPVMIPKGTRVTPDGEIYFATTTALTINAGETNGTVTAVSTVGGAKNNGFLPGQINLLVDPISYVASVRNIDISSGGSDEETDDAYRDRQRLAPASFSVAGPKDAYVFFAKSADVDIIDVEVITPAPCEVEIYPLMKGGTLPGADTLQQVMNEVSGATRRPLTDRVKVLAPTVVDYSIDLTYYISADRSYEEAVIRSDVEGVGGAADQYEVWQRSKLGRAITPDDLIARIYRAGAYRVVTISPQYTEITDSQVAKRIGVRKLTYGGLI
ncbi:baseplate J/gp47 family protein [Paenibacillus sp. NPDC058367]|uniref:baseplate assembly protein n=1 Tax=Paenibacillus sp. NPDC058367 TaxID=3346460 RepID=UPI0036592F10